MYSVCLAVGETGWGPGALGTPCGFGVAFPPAFLVSYKSLAIPHLTQARLNESLTIDFYTSKFASVPVSHFVTLTPLTLMDTPHINKPFTSL